MSVPAVVPVLFLRRGHDEPLAAVERTDDKGGRPAPTLAPRPVAPTR